MATSSYGHGSRPLSVGQIAQISDPVERLTALINFQIKMATFGLDHIAVFFDTIPYAAQSGVIVDVNPRYAGQAVIGMTSWIYKWPDPARHSADEFAETCIRLIFGPSGQRPQS